MNKFLHTPMVALKAAAKAGDAAAVEVIRGAFNLADAPVMAVDDVPAFSVSKEHSTTEVAEAAAAEGASEETGEPVAAIPARGRSGARP